MDRFDLEERISDMCNIESELETLIYKIGDSPESPSEDEILNLLIGIVSLHRVRYERLWSTFEQLIETNVITTKNIQQTTKDGS